MKRAGRQITPSSADIVDFDEALFDACPAAQQADLLREARLLASVFAPGGEGNDLLRMAAQLSAGSHDTDMGRAHARRLAAALKYLAKAA